MSLPNSVINRQWRIAQEQQAAKKAARDQRVADLLAEADRAKAERIHKERTDMSQTVITAIRARAASLIEQGQDPKAAMENATKAHLFANPDAKIDEATFEGLPSSAQSAYVNARMAADPNADMFAPGPETPTMKAVRHAKGILTDDEAKEAQAAIEEEYRVKRVAKVVNRAREEQAADINAYMQRGATREEAASRYPLSSYAPDVPAADVEAVDAAEAKAKADWFRVGDDSGSEDSGDQ